MLDVRRRAAGRERKARRERLEFQDRDVGEDLEVAAAVGIGQRRIVA